MNILFITLLDFSSLDTHNLYTDLLNEFVKNGHHVSIVSPTERRKKQKTHFIYGEGYEILKIKIGNITKTNLFEKGISTLLIETRYISAIKKYFKKKSFDMVIYSTPPITFTKIINYLKRKNNTYAYLLLKDIFPQNAIDLNIFKKSGVKGLLYEYFRRKEQKMYRISDSIGCMSEANKHYIVDHNPDINPSIVHVNPNSIFPFPIEIDSTQKRDIFSKYNLPFDKKIFIYGGNLGKPQGIDFLIECIKQNEKRTDVLFLIVGDGTEYEYLNKTINNSKIQNTVLLKTISKHDFNILLKICYAGFIFLDKRFTIPNYPSRLLSYLQAEIPIIAATDNTTDIGIDIINSNIGLWSLAGDVNGFNANIERMLNIHERNVFASNTFTTLKNKYNVVYSYQQIIRCYTTFCNEKDR